MPVGVSSFSGRKLRAMRDRRGMSQMNLAVKAGLNYQVIGLLERDTRPPTAATLRKLARALRCREADLLITSSRAA